MDDAALIRPQVAALKPYTPGTTVAQAQKAYGLTSFVKLSSNENPLGTSPRALDAIHALRDLNIYVDDDHSELRERLAAPYGLEARHVMVGHGSNDVVRTLFTTLVAPGDEVVLADPTFSLFAKDTALFAGVPVKVPLRKGVHDLDAMLRAVTAKTKMVVVVDPNNPTSTRVEAEAFDRFARELPAGVVLLIDQAYREYMPPGSVEAADYVAQRPATIVLRTMSKIYGFASLRFGYALGDPQLLGYAERVRVPFGVSRPAAVAARAALDDTEFLERSVATNEAGKAMLYPAFERLGLHAYPTAANFVALALPATARDPYEEMLRRGVVTRSGAALGMPGRLRITIGAPDQNAILVAALESLVAAAA